LEIKIRFDQHTWNSGDSQDDSSTFDDPKIPIEAKDGQEIDYFQILPKHILHQITEFIDQENFNSLSLTCKRLHGFANECFFYNLLLD
jgi:hypothetical protein